jgi:hypothetical protein
MSDPYYEPVIVNENGESMPDVAKHEARHVADDAKQGTAQVAETAKQEAREVASDAKRQAKDVYRQVRGEVSDQASTQQQRAASGLHSIAGELDQMASGSQANGVAADLAQQAAQRARAFATWLEAREPGDLAEELRSFARRRPGAFIAGAAAVGLLAGRMTRGLTDAPDESPSERANRLAERRDATGAEASGLGRYHDVATPSADVPTASLAMDEEGTTYTTGSRLDEGPLDDTRLSGPLGDDTVESDSSWSRSAPGSESAFQETELGSEASYDTPSTQGAPRSPGEAR